MCFVFVGSNCLILACKKKMMMAVSLCLYVCMHCICVFVSADLLLVMFSTSLARNVLKTLVAACC